MGDSPLTTATRIARRYLLHARLLWLAAPGAATLNLLLAMASATASTLTLVAIGHFIGSLPAAFSAGAGSAAATTAWHWLIATGAVFVAGPVFGAAQQAVTQTISARYLATTFDMALEVGTAPYDVERLEDPEAASRLEALVKAMREWMFVNGVDSTWEVLSFRLSGVGAFIVVCSWHWWVAAILVVGFLLLNKVFNNWINTLWDELLDLTGGERREASYLRDLLTTPAIGKEIRLFGLNSWLLERFRATWTAAMVTLWKRRNKTMQPMVWALLLLFALYLGAFGLLSRDALSGAISVSILATLAQALFALESFGPMGDPQSMLARNTATAAELVDLRRELGLPDVPDRKAVRALDPPATLPAAAPAEHRPAAIDFDHVAFAYPSREEPTFSDLSLHIPAGQSVAVVGVNGAGKSTLIKLLCGLHRPSAGTVRVDGADPGTDARARRRVAVIFQEFVRYHLSLRDNVGFGAVSQATDTQLLQQSLDDAGGGDLPERLEHGWDTVLSPGYADGTDLSGGQWQRVALARALVSVHGGAGVLVLDEPTAALDVRAEAMLFDRFLRLTSGLTTLLVSHRLSSVRHADRIIVIGQTAAGHGCIIEDGSHEQLMAAGGEYAAMFTLQARRFAQAGAAAQMNGAPPDVDASDVLADDLPDDLTDDRTGPPASPDPTASTERQR